MTKEELQNVYTYFVADEGTEAFKIIDEYINHVRTTRDFRIANFENQLGVASCMDMDLYKNYKNYYLIVDLRHKIGDQVVHPDLKQISFKEFAEAIEKSYEHFGFVGGRYFNMCVLNPYLEELKITGKC